MKKLLWLALITPIAFADPADPTKKDGFDAGAQAITDIIVQPMAKNLSDRIMRDMAENGGAMAPGAKQYLEKRKVEEQIAYDDAMKRKHEAIMREKQRQLAILAEKKRCKVDCRPRPIQECMKPNYTVDDDVIGCSQGLITKSW